MCYSEDFLRTAPFEVKKSTIQKSIWQDPVQTVEILLVSVQPVQTVQKIELAIFSLSSIVTFQPPLVCME